MSSDGHGREHRDEQSRPQHRPLCCAVANRGDHMRGSPSSKTCADMPSWDCLTMRIDKIIMTNQRCRVENVGQIEKFAEQCSVLSIFLLEFAIYCFSCASVCSEATLLSWRRWSPWSKALTGWPLRAGGDRQARNVVPGRKQPGGRNNILTHSRSYTHQRQHTPLLTSIHPHRSLQTLLISEKHQIMEQMYTAVS